MYNFPNISSINTNEYTLFVKENSLAAAAGQRGLEAGEDKGVRLETYVCPPRNKKT
jgi:hypothetical protein